MPSIRDQSTVNAIAREFTSNGRNKTEAMVTVGYKQWYAEGGRGQGVVYTNERVIEAIRLIDEAGAAKSETTVESVQEMYNAAYKLAEDSKQPSAMVSAVTGIARLYGMDKDASTDQAQTEQLDAKQAEQANRLANIVLSTAQEAS